PSVPNSKLARPGTPTAVASDCAIATASATSSRTSLSSSCVSAILIMRNLVVQNPGGRIDRNPNVCTHELSGCPTLVKLLRAAVRLAYARIDGRRHHSRRHNADAHVQ